MPHRPYEKIVPGSEVAVLLIHGIAETPNHFSPFLPLFPESWSIYNMLLDGHGQGVAEFGASSMEKWKAQVARQLDEILSRHKRVMIVGHSMGCLFAIQSAVRYPQRVAALYLLASPLRVFVRPSAVIGSIKISLGRVKETDRTAIAMRNDTSIRLEPGAWKYRRWVPRLLELLREIRLTRKLLSRLQVAGLAFLSENDELVSLKTARELKKSPCLQVSVLPNSGHFEYAEDDLELLRQELRNLIEKIEE